MTVEELIKVNESLLKLMCGNGIDPVMVRHLEMYQDYKRLTEEGHKKTYIVRYLSEVYHVNERTVYRVVNKMGQDVLLT